MKFGFDVKFAQVLPGEKVQVGHPVRNASAPNAYEYYAGVYHHPCPFCHGLLYVIPQCNGRAVGDSDATGKYPLQEVPTTHLPVACQSCRQAFFPLKDNV